MTFGPEWYYDLITRESCLYHSIVQAAERMAALKVETHVRCRTAIVSAKCGILRDFEVVKELQ